MRLILYSHVCGWRHWTLGSEPMPEHSGCELSAYPIVSIDPNDGPRGHGVDSFHDERVLPSPGDRGSWNGQSATVVHGVVDRSSVLIRTDDALLWIDAGEWRSDRG